MTRLAEALDLRDYQFDALDKLRALIRSGKRKLVLVAPTGAGKTVIAAKMAQLSRELGNRVLFLAHRRELITQAADKLQRSGVNAGIIMAGEKPQPSLPVQVASIQTLARRSKPPADLVIVDECHHATSDSWRNVIDAYPNATIIGLTATPWRTDRVGLKDLFEDSVLAATPAQLIKSGALCPYEAYAYDAPDLHNVKVRAGEFQSEDLALACNTSVLVGNVVREYQAHTIGKRALVFAVNVEHSMALVGQFNDADIPARHVDYKTPKAERDEAIQDMRSGQILVLSSVSLFSEGFDLPSAEVCIMARPTMSLSLHLQMMGRVMRPALGKQRAIISDHGGNLLRHGLLDEERDYSLGATPKSVRELHSCPFCRAVFGRPKDDGSCPKCGEIIAPPIEVREENERRRKEQLEGERIDRARIEELRKQRANAVPESKKVLYYLELQKQAREKNYKPTWVGVRFKLRYGYWPKFTSEQIAAAKAAAPKVTPRRPATAYEERFEEGCTCFLGHPPCSWCTSREATG